MFCEGVQIREGGPNPLADMDRGGPNPLADLDRGVQIRGGSKSAVTPAQFRSSRHPNESLERATAIAKGHLKDVTFTFL